MITNQQLLDAPIGAVIVSYGDGPKPRGLAGLALKAAYSAIRKHQRFEHPTSKRADGVHIIVKVGHGGRAGMWVSAEYPRVIETDSPIQPDRKYRLYRYAFDLTAPAEFELAGYARSMVGKKYDTLQLLGIATSAQRFLPLFFRRWLGRRLQIPGMLEVCSTLAHRAILKAWEVLGASFAVRPLGKADPFDVYPALFENHYTYELIGEQNV